MENFSSSADSPENDNIVVRCRDLSKNWDDLTAVRSISIDIPKGSIVALVGPNGAGKSTWMKMIAGLVESTSGTAEVCGIDVTRSPRQVHRFVGFLPDFFGLYENLTTEEYLTYFCLCYGISGNSAKERVNHLLACVSLENKRNDLLDNLSRGMKQRVAIARSLIADPPLLILDEPSAGLDPESRADLQRLLLSLASEGKTLIVSSHILSELQEYSSHVAILQKGSLIAWGPTKTLALESQTDQDQFQIRLRLLQDSPMMREKVENLDSRLKIVDQEASLFILNFEGSYAEIPELLRKIGQESPPFLSLGLAEKNIQDVYLKYMKGSQND